MAAASGGRDLMVVKRGLVGREFARRFGKVRTRRAGRAASSMGLLRGAANSAGVGLNQGVRDRGPAGYLPGR